MGPFPMCRPQPSSNLRTRWSSSDGCAASPRWCSSTMKQKRNGEREFEKPSSGLQEQRGAGAEHVKSAETSAVTPGPISRAVRIHEVPTIPYQSFFFNYAAPAEIY